MFDEDFINKKDINICFFSGKIISEPEFKFFYNRKNFFSKVSFWLKTEKGFSSSKRNSSVVIKLIAYNEIADLVYRNCSINDNVIVIGSLNNNEIVIDKIDFRKIKKMCLD